MGFVTTEVGEYDPNYQRVNGKFQDSKITLTKMLKIESDTALKLFDQEKLIMEKQRKLNSEDETKVGQFRILELYHGSSESFEQVLVEGLDERNLKHFGHFGRGIYFSDSPAFARIEAEAGKKPKVIYKCKVLLGNSKVYPKHEVDMNLTREPKAIIDGKLITYDSVEGNVDDFTQYVVYERRRVLVQYALLYDTEEPLPKLSTLRNNMEKEDVLSAGSGDESRSGSGSEGSFHSLDEQEDEKRQKPVKRKKLERPKDPIDPSGIKREALAYMLTNKNLFTQNQYQDLLVLFLKTYLDHPDDDFQPIKEQGSTVSILVEEFCRTSKCPNNAEAKIFLELNNWDVNDAALDYITMIK